MMLRSFWLTAALLAAIPLIACTTAKPDDVVGALQKVANVERGKPILAFVYTDG